MSQVEKANPNKNVQRQKPQHEPAPQRQGPGRDDGNYQIVENPHGGGGAMSVEQANAEGKGLWLQRKGEAPSYRTPFMVQMHGAGTIKSPRSDIPRGISRNQLQTKVKIGEPGDQFEQEADQVADRVVKHSPGQGDAAAAEGNVAQRKLQRKQNTATPPIQSGESLENRLESRKGGGNPLPPDTQERMEGAIGADFSGVRIHTDGEAKGMSKDLNAHAFTHGNDIYFNEGKYNPGTKEGDHLLAHELTHTVQQGAAPATQKGAGEGVNPGADGNTVQAKVDYTKTNDGEAPRQRLEQKQLEGIDQDKLAEGRKKSRKEAKQDAAKADPAEKAKKRKENNKLAKPDVDNPGKQKEKTKEASKETKGKVDNPPELAKKEKDAGKDKKKAKKQEVTPEATEAEAKKTAALATASSLEEPEAPPPVESPGPVEYKDGNGNPLPPDAEAEATSSKLVAMAQTIRQRGFAFRKEAVIALRQAFQSEAAWMEQQKNLSISEHYLGLGGKNLEQRKSLIAEADQAHAKSEERADTVLREVPKKLEETKSGLESTGPIAKDTEEQKAANAETASDDAESNAKSKEQGGSLDESGNKVASIGSGIEGADKELTQLQEKTTEAKTKNADSKAKITKTKGDLQAMDDQVGQMNEVNKKGRKALAATQKEPAAMKKEAKQIDQKGQSLIEGSKEMEQKLREAAKNRSKRNPTVPAPQPDDGGPIQTKSAGGGIIQRALGDYAASRGETDIDATPDEKLTKEEREIKERNKQELAHIKSMIGDRNMADITATEKISIGLRARFSRFGSWVSEKFTFANVGKLFIDLINPVNWAKFLAAGIPGGMMMIVSGVKGLIDNFGFNWATVKALADIATGVAVVAATVAGISIAIAAINAVLVFLTFGGWLTVATPMAPILANIISWSGTIAFWAGAIGLTLNLIALGKSLMDVGAVSSAEQLQAQMNDVEEDSGRALQAALSMEVGAATMGQAGKLIPQQLLNSAKTYGLIGIMGGRGAAMRAYMGDLARGFGPAIWAMMTFRATRRKVGYGFNRAVATLGLVKPTKIIVSSPSQLAATKPVKTKDGYTWNLYDKKSGAVFTDYVNASETMGPDQYLLPAKAKLPNGKSAILEANPKFSWTDESIKLNLETYKSVFGKKAPNLSGEIADTNLAAFQKNYASIREANPSLSHQEVGDLAIKNTPFGKGRTKAGYGDLSVQMDKMGHVKIDGKIQYVPTDVKVNALPTQ